MRSRINVSILVHYGKSVFSYLLVCVLVTTCLLLGRVIHQYVAILPPSLYGMLLFALTLSIGNRTQLMTEKLIHQPIAVMLKYLSFIFVPVSVGLMQYGDLLLQHGVKILLVGCVTTLCVITLVAWLSKRLLGEHSRV